MFCFGTARGSGRVGEPRAPCAPGAGHQAPPRAGRAAGERRPGGRLGGGGGSVPGNRDGARPRPGDPRSAPVCAHPGAGGRSPQASPVSRRSSLRPSSPVPGAGGAAAARAGVPVPGAPPLPLRSVISRPVGSAGLCGSGDPVRPPSAPPGPGPPAGRACAPFPPPARDRGRRRPGMQIPGAGGAASAGI